MATLGKVDSTFFSKVKERVVKLLLFGRDDVRTAEEAMPYGVDSSPIKGMIAVYAETSAKGDPVIIGYINKNQLALVGEHRIYSTDQNGVLKTFIWLKNDGTMLLGGSTKNLTRFQELEAGFNQLKSDFNAHVSKYNGHTHTGSTGPIVPAGASTPSSADISGAKIDEIKTL